MTAHLFRKTTRIRRPATEVFAWHERPGALERLTPPWEKMELLEAHGGIRDGARVKVRSKVGPLWLNWDVEHRDYVEGKQFRDVQVRGPFAAWEHLHRFEQVDAAASDLTDEIRYELPFGAAGRWMTAAAVHARLERLLTYRHAVTDADVRMAARYGSVRSLRILISGASGLVGRALVPFLRSQGHEVSRLVRRKPVVADEVFWDPASNALQLSSLKPFDAVIHLAGENVGNGRWTRGRREAILRSRVEGTRTLVAALAPLRHRPFVFVSASAIGFYGDRGEQVVTEDDARGNGFLAEVCTAWENEVAAAEALEIRAVALRTGVVLTPAGGALGKMLPFFRAGLGGRLGDGRQWMSWISIDDLVGAFYHALLDQRCGGPVNAVAPEAVTNVEFTATLARVLRRPAVLPVPAIALRAMFGRMADETVLASARVSPERLKSAGYVFRHERVEDALRHVLGRTAPGD